MSNRRIQITGAWRDGLYAGKHSPPGLSTEGCFFLAILGILAVALVGLFLFLSAGATVNPNALPTAESQVIYLVVPGAAPTRAVPATAPTRAAPTLTPRPAGKPPADLNGIPFNQIIVVSDPARQRIRQIYAQGQAAGRNSRAFARVGDSTMVYPPFLAAFEDPGGYKLGPYDYLQPAIAYFAGSFGHNSPAVKKGMHTWTEFDPTWNNPDLCQPGETPLACEFRLTNPSVVIIRLGANDVPEPASFKVELEKILDFWIGKGVIPIVGTKPDRQDADNSINNIVRQTAVTYRIPLWDYDAVVGTIPGRGLEADHVHMRGGGSHDYTAPSTLSGGDSVEDLTALMMLEAVRREMVAGSTQP
ncbi:MAG: hypothetical protein WCF84_06100 [Anaerolineae bacterium]